MEIWKACKIVKEIKDRAWCGTDDMETTIRISREKEALDTVLKVCVDTINLFEDWRKDIKKRRFTRCINCRHWKSALGGQCEILTVNNVAHCTSPDWFCADWEDNLQNDSQKERLKSEEANAGRAEEDPAEVSGD